MKHAAFRTLDLPPPEFKHSLPPPPMIIAIDGPAASGKGTLARKIAARFDFAYLDTGGLYRAVAHQVLKMGLDARRSQDAAAAIDALLEQLSPALLAAPELRSEDVSQNASIVAAHPYVREKLLAYQRDFAQRGGQKEGQKARGAVLDGRDIGTVICPMAEVKLFITASAEVRAKRRADELLAKGQKADYDEILSDIRKRDERDMSRKTAPLKPAHDAFVIDTSQLSASDVLAEALNIIRAHLAKRAL